MSKLRLIKPCKEFYFSYIELVEEFRFNNEKPVPFVLTYPHEDMDLLLSRFENDSKGITPNNFVPNTTFWLVDQGDVVGVSNLRHVLNDSLKIEGGHIGYGIRPSRRGYGYGKDILRLTILEAKKINIKEQLITCNKDNIRSSSVIKSNGGVFESEEYIESYGGVVQRYWIRDF
jgi:predicted acetyltransferase